MRKILIYFFLIFVFNSGNNFQAQAGTKGVLQYCIYQGQWSLIFKFEKKLYIKKIYKYLFTFYR